uniref:Neurotransmitter-gated ion-channel transmembrane domain-containing protein n=1 Tax=Trichogramma kaykai TaxID=54128 RepID=A0ABD2WSV1_9HYME
MDERMRFVSEFLFATTTCVIFTTFVDCPLVNKQIRFVSKFLLTLFACEIFVTFMNYFLVVKEEPNVTWSNSCDDYILDSSDSYKQKTLKDSHFLNHQ